MCNTACAPAARNGISGMLPSAAVVIQFLEHPHLTICYNCCNIKNIARYMLMLPRAVTVHGRHCYILRDLQSLIFLSLKNHMTGGWCFPFHFCSVCPHAPIYLSHTVPEATVWCCWCWCWCCWCCWCWPFVSLWKELPPPESRFLQTGKPHILRGPQLFSFLVATTFFFHFFLPFFLPLFLPTLTLSRLISFPIEALIF